MRKLLIIGSLLLSACSAPYSSRYVDTRSTNGVNYDYSHHYASYNNYYRGQVPSSNSYYYLNTNYARSLGYEQKNLASYQGYGFQYRFTGEKSLLLTDIVSKMSDQLLFNLPAGYYDEAIALTSLVDLSEHYETNWLGQTISELFIHELHIRNLRVLDFKLTGNIRVTPKGEFALSRNWKELNKSIDVFRILTGTMSRNEEGVILNVRIVNSVTNFVESTTRAFIPYELFVGGKYDYRNRKYYSRDSSAINKVKLVK